MNRRQWFDSDVRDMLDFIARGCDPTGLTAPVRPVGPRSLRLFGVACCRHVWAALTDPRSRRAVEVAERYADGEADDEDLKEADAMASESDLVENDSVGPADLASWVCSASPDEAIDAIDRYGARAGVPDELRAALLRDVVGDPFERLVLPFAWRDTTRRTADGCTIVEARCDWLTPDVRSLAAAAYECRADDGRLEAARLGILSDALEEAGCPSVWRRDCPACRHSGKTGCVHRHGKHGPGYYPCRSCDERGFLDAPHPLLEHLRGREPHVRGCWVLDLLLEKEPWTNTPG